MDTVEPQVTGRRSGKRKQSPVTVPTESKLALSISEFCATHNISEAFYFELQKLGRGPRTMSVGRRRLISLEEARRWREECSA
jgi:hypothetical protein